MSDGVIVIDPSQLRGKQGPGPFSLSFKSPGRGLIPSAVLPPTVFVMLSCTFRYGRQDMDVMGVAFQRDLFVATRQVYPELQDKEKLTHTKVQEKLLRKLGDNAFPFFLEFPDNLPNSVSLQPGPTDVGKKCSVEFEVKAFCAGKRDEKIDKQSSVCLTIRKIQYSPRDNRVAPVAETTFDFLMSEKPLHVKLSLPKETFYHGEPVQANVEITNASNRNVKDISLSVDQVTNVILYSDDKYVKSVAREETRDCVASGSSLEKRYTLYPRLEHNKDRRGIALDGRLKHEDTNLASSSIVKQEVLKELQGMLVSYKMVLKMMASGPLGSSEVCVELPFQLMHPKPEEAKATESDDICFEDFKRSFLRGVVGDDDDDSPSDT